MSRNKEYIKETMKFEAVYIEWDDSIIYDSKWINAEDLKEDSQHINYCHELGFIINEDDKYILLAARYLIISDDEEMEPDVGSPIRIPKSQIRKMVKLDLK